MFSDLFVDPISKKKLTLDSVAGKASVDDINFSFDGKVIDFNERLIISTSSNSTTQFDDAFIPAPSVDTAPELRDYHDKAFQKASDEGENLYGNLEDLPLITQLCHYRRIEILQSLNLGDMSNKTAVDFGTGPWGFASIFPKLRQAGCCIGFDVSKVALVQASIVDSNLQDKVIYATSDGERIGLKDSSVDVFFGGEVIEHVRNPMLFVKEIARICKDDALIILTTPNRDALFYKANDLPYCTGPEHIALLNNEELRSILDTFCTNVDIFGYEISLSPDIDSQLKDENLIKSINLRSMNFPSLASGLISIGSIKKSKYEKTLGAEYLINEHLWNSIIFPKAKGDAVSLFGDVEGISLSEDFKFGIPIKSKNPSLLFWGHDWSGLVAIDMLSGTDKTTRIYDLYLPRGGFYRVDLNLPMHCSKIEIRRTGEKSIRSKSSEVIFYKFFEYVESATH